nr:hypothetical protein [Streptomyces sp. L2]
MTGGEDQAEQVVVDVVRVGGLLRRGGQPGGVEHDAGLGDLLDQRAHPLHQLLAGASGGGGGLVDSYE